LTFFCCGSEVNRFQIKSTKVKKKAIGILERKKRGFSPGKTEAGARGFAEFSFLAAYLKRRTRRFSKRRRRKEI